MGKSKFEKMFLDVINGKSIRECEKIYGINRNKFITICKQLFPEGSDERTKLEQILSKNKAELQRKQIEDEKLRDVIEGLISGEIKSKIEALEILDGIVTDVTTLGEKMAEYVNNSNDRDLRARYIGYLAKKNPDYSNINFKALIIEMIRGQYSQTEIARLYNIPPRTVSRELAKLEHDEVYHDLYTIAKELADRQVLLGNSRQRSNRKIFTKFETRLIDNQLEDYDEGKVIIANAKSLKTRKYEKSKSLLDDVAKTGLSKKEAAEKLGVSVSSIRRAKIFVKNYEKENKSKEIE